jgi:lipid-A-disaccharide synthase
LRRLITSQTSVLPNLVLGEKAIPEFHQEDCTGPRMANALAPLLDDGSPERERQLAALARVPGRMLLASGTPSEAAAHIVLNYAEHGRGWPRSLDLSRVGSS